MSDLFQMQYQKKLISIMAGAARCSAVQRGAAEAHDPSNTGDFHDVVLFGTTPWHKERAPHHSIVVVPPREKNTLALALDRKSLLSLLGMQESSFPPTFFGSTPQMPGIWQEAMRS